MKNFIEKYDNVLPSIICNRLIRIAKENPDLSTPGSTVATRHLGLEETQKVKKTLDWDIKDKIDFFLIFFPVFVYLYVGFLLQMRTIINDNDYQYQFVAT